MRKIEQPTEKQKLRLNYGCSCGKCIGGFLSARMQLSVKTKAQECHDFLSIMLRTAPSSEAFVEGAHEFMKYVDSYTKYQMKAHETWCATFVDTFNSFAAILDNKTIPNQDAVRSIANQNAHNLTSSTHRAIGSIIFEMAMNADAIAGFGPRTPNVELQAELAELPECRNGMEDGFVSGMCGYRHVSRGHTIEHVRENAVNPKSNMFRRTRPLPGHRDVFGFGERAGRLLS